MLHIVYKDYVSEKLRYNNILPKTEVTLRLQEFFMSEILCSHSKPKIP